MIWTTQKSHVRSQTSIHLSLCQRTHKTPTIQCTSLLGLSFTNWQGNKMLQSRIWNLPPHLLQRTTSEMARTPSHGQIHPQHSHILDHWQIPILPNHGIWTTILPIPWKDLSSSSWAATQPNRGHMEGSQSHPQIGTTTHERIDLLSIQTLESWRQSLAQNQKSQTPCTF